MLDSISIRVDVGFLSPKRLDPTLSCDRWGPNGKAGTTQPSFYRFTDAPLRVLLWLFGQHRWSRKAQGSEKKLRHNMADRKCRTETAQLK